MVWHGFHWNTTYGHMKQTFILKFTPRSWNHIFSTTKVKKWQIFHHKKINATQFLPQDHLHVMMQLSTNILFIYQTEKWLQSFSRPQQSLRYKIPYNNPKTSSLLYSTRKNPISLSIYRIYLSVCLSVCLSVSLSIYLSICKLENEAILRDFLNFCIWQHQKRSNSARLPHV